jgi:hypothetical protein
MKGLEGTVQPRYRLRPHLHRDPSLSAQAVGQSLDIGERVRPRRDHLLDQGGEILGGRVLGILGGRCKVIRKLAQPGFELGPLVLEILRHLSSLSGKLIGTFLEASRSLVELGLELLQRANARQPVRRLLDVVADRLELGLKPGPAVANRGHLARLGRRRRRRRRRALLVATPAGGSDQAEQGSDKHEDDRPTSHAQGLPVNASFQPPCRVPLNQADAGY